MNGRTKVWSEQMYLAVGLLFLVVGVVQMPSSTAKGIGGLVLGIAWILISVGERKRRR